MFTFSCLRRSLILDFRLKNKSSVPSFPQYSRNFCHLCWRGEYKPGSAPKELALKAPLSEILLLLHCVAALQRTLYAWSRPDVLEQCRTCTGTNVTTSNLNSHITIGIGIGYRYNNRLSVSAEKFSIGASQIFIFTIWIWALKNV